MIRILMFLLGAVFFAFVITYFASLDSRITGEAFGYHFDGPSGLIMGGLMVLFLAAIYLTHKIKDILAIPAKIKAKDAQTKRERGIAALTRGLEAAAAGDGEDAAHHARVARRNLEDVALTRLLTAQAAQLSGDAAAAKESFSAMLAAPETEFIGLKGLYAQAMAAGEHDAAKGYAERAFRLRPNAAWAFQSVFDLGLERGAWNETRAAVINAQKNKVIESARADRARAALLTADAHAESDPAAAMSEAEAALKLAPDFTPASALAARIAMDEGKTAKAAKILEAGFTASAHPALIKLYDRLCKDDAPEKRAARLTKLAEKNPASDEAALLKARAATLTEDWQGAVDALEAHVSKTASPAAFSLMAKAAAGLRGEAAAQVWYEHAASAPRDPRPGADGAFHLTREGWARLIREYMDFARLSPPPIEEATAGLAPEEVRLLLAPPVIEEPEAAPVDESASDESEVPLAAPAEKTAPADKDGSLYDDPEGDDHIHDDEEAERAANAARNVS
ncbi:heme biosynthesis protein HemY [Marinicaulis aureus]|uniref:Heme biosynthesis protein HemY n=1 Tax=Hyphococcus aureus TaxID=2666033 RepID=A0ABW1KRU9_9PROT